LDSTSIEIFFKTTTALIFHGLNTVPAGLASIACLCSYVNTRFVFATLT